MRVRLQAAVHALLADESVAGLPDAARLAAVVVLAKGAMETGSTVLWSGELGRWLGVSISMVSHRVLPPLRARGALQTTVVTDEYGEPVALNLTLEPVARLRRARDVRHPLALTRSELATLLRLCETLFGPGWAPANAAPTPPGLLARQEREQRHGAATDRLALLLLVLSCRESGRLKLCSGTLRAPELGRGAATLALLLRGGAKPVTPAAAYRVLTRLENAGVVEVERGEGAAPSGRVTLLPVAASYAAARPAKAPSPARPAARPQLPQADVPQATSPAAAPACPDAEAVQEAAAASSLPSVSTEGDLERSGRSAEGLADSGPAEMPAEAPGSADSASADFHAPHAPMVTQCGDVNLVDGFSGACAVGVTHRRPERAGAREDDPLRGEQPTETSTTDRERARRLPVRRLGPTPEVPVVLEPVAELWRHIDRDYPRDLVLTAVEQQLEQVAGWVGPDGAVRALQQRLGRRLQAEGGSWRVRNAAAWLLGKGLPQRQRCGHGACDDGFHVATGAVCEGCTEVLAAKRARRRTIVRDVVQATPELSFEDRRQLIEERLRACSEAAAEQHEAAMDSRKQRDAKLARLRAEREAAKLLLPCADCGIAASAGLCGLCGTVRETQGAINEYVDLVLTFRADLGSRQDAVAVVRQARAEVREAMRQAVLELGPAGSDVHGAASAERFAALSMVDTARAEALAALARTATADTEAQRAQVAERRRYGDRLQALLAGQAAGRQARERTAQWLLNERLEAVREMRAGRPARVPGRP